MDSTEGSADSTERREQECERGYPTFKGLLIGEGDSGKKNFMWRHLTGEYVSKQLFKRMDTVNSLLFYTSRGPVCFEILDTAGKETFGNTQKDDYAGAQCAILFFDLNSLVTYNKILNPYRDLGVFCGPIPVVLCAHNEGLSKKRADWPLKISIKSKVKYYEVCTKRNHNIEKPFAWLAKVLLGDPELEFVPGPALAPPLVTADRDVEAKLEQDLMEALKHPLPEDDEENDL